ncbi:MAG: AAA family ATPase [Planctomycetota bacterium]
MNKSDQEFVSAVRGQGRTNRIVFHPISALGPCEPPEWCWRGFVAKGHATLLAALWKCGKSTLIGHLLRDMCGVGAGGLAEPVDGPMLVVSEESSAQWSKRREDLSLTDQVRVCSRPFTGTPTFTQWEDVVMGIAEDVDQQGASLVILDTLSALWPVQDENDAARVSRALNPLRTMMERGAGLLLVHHIRKGDGGEGQASRGSGALPSFVDAIVELRRYDTGNLSDTRRKLTAYGRFDELVPEMVIELTDKGYQSAGVVCVVHQEDQLEAIAKVLRGAQSPITESEIRDLWPEGVHPPGRTRMSVLLREGTQSARWLRGGQGVKGSPFTYAINHQTTDEETSDSIRSPLAPYG